MATSVSEESVGEDVIVKPLDSFNESDVNAELHAMFDGDTSSGVKSWDSYGLDSYHPADSLASDFSNPLSIQPNSNSTAFDYPEIPTANAAYPIMGNDSDAYAVGGLAKLEGRDPSSNEPSESLTSLGSAGSSDSSFPDTLSTSWGFSEERLDLWEPFYQGQKERAP